MEPINDPTWKAYNTNLSPRECYRLALGKIKLGYVERDLIKGYTIEQAYDMYQKYWNENKNKIERRRKIREAKRKAYAKT